MIQTKKWLCLILCLAMLASMSVTALAAEDTAFTDLTDVPWAATAIHALAANGIVNGVSATEFNPNGLVTREQFAKMLVLACDFPYQGATCDYYDVVTGAWYYRYVSEANRQGIMKGINEEYLGIGQNITRQDLCTMAYRALQIKGVSLAQTSPAVIFTDEAAIADYAGEAVHALQQAGIVNGMADGSFAPQGVATRAQAAKIIFGVYAYTNTK